MNQDDLKRNIIKIVRQHRCLYDTSMREYSLNDHRERSWEKAAREASISVSEIKKVYERLRQQYTRELKKSHQRGDSFDSYWPFFSELSFLYPFVKPRRPKRKLVKEVKEKKSKDKDVTETSHSPGMDESQSSSYHNDTDYLRDAIVLESDSEENFIEEKLEVNKDDSIRSASPTNEDQPDQHDTTYAAEESDGNVVMAAESSTNIDVLSCYLKIIQQKLQKLPEGLAEDHCIRFIRQLNEVLRN